MPHHGIDVGQRRHEPLVEHLVAPAVAAADHAQVPRRPKASSSSIKTMQGALIEEDTHCAHADEHLAALGQPHARHYSSLLMVKAPSTLLNRPGFSGHTRAEEDPQA